MDGVGNRREATAFACDTIVCVVLHRAYFTILFQELNLQHQPPNPNPKQATHTHRYTVCRFEFCIRHIYSHISISIDAVSSCTAVVTQSTMRCVVIEHKKVEYPTVVPCGTKIR